MLYLTHPAAAEAEADAPPPTIVRDFGDPYLELVRLLREASEIEHALLVQYLYAMFSIKAEYAGVRDNSPNGDTTLLDVAIQEMQHLEQVNRLLAELHAAPNLIRQDFPYEPDIYPFPLNLESLSPVSTARYVFTEAAASALDPDDPAHADPATQAFLGRLQKVLGAGVRPNHLGSLYGVIIDRLREVIAAAVPGVGDLPGWETTLDDIRRQGEDGHFAFFRDVFTGAHPGFLGRADVWSLDPTDAAYPAIELPTNPSAFTGHDNAIVDPGHRRIAWLSDLHYWLVLGLLDIGYRTGNQGVGGQAVRHMTGALRPLGTHLATLGVGVPFDPLSMGYAPGHDVAGTVFVLRRLVVEAATVAAELAPVLPAGLSLTALTNRTLTVLDGIVAAPVGNPVPVP